MHSANSISTTPLSSEKPPALAAARAVHPPRNGSRAGPRGRLTRPCVSPAVHWRRSGRCGWNLASGPPRPVAADEPPRLKLARAGRASTVPVAAVVGRVHHQSCVRHGGRGAAATCAQQRVLGQVCQPPNLLFPSEKDRQSTGKDRKWDFRTPRGTLETTAFSRRCEIFTSKLILCHLPLRTSLSSKNFAPSGEPNQRKL